MSYRRQVVAEAEDEMSEVEQLLRENGIAFGEDDRDLSHAVASLRDAVGLLRSGLDHGHANLVLDGLAEAAAQCERLATLTDT